MKQADFEEVQEAIQDALASEKERREDIEAALENIANHYTWTDDNDRKWIRKNLEWLVAREKERN